MVVVADRGMATKANIAQIAEPTGLQTWALELVKTASLPRSHRRATPPGSEKPVQSAISVGEGEELRVGEAAAFGAAHARGRPRPTHSLGCIGRYGCRSCISWFTSYAELMEIPSARGSMALRRAAVDAQGAQREGLIRAIAQDVVKSLGALGLQGEEYAQLTVESLKTLDAAGLLARDSLRRCLEALHEPDGGVDLLVAEFAGLLREAAAVETLGVERRIRAVKMASEWREHVLGRPRSKPAYLSVGDVAARYGVSTRAVYKWLQKGRIEATRGPGGLWRIPAAQFARDSRPSTSRKRLDELMGHLIAVQGAAELPPEEELGERMRAES